MDLDLLARLVLVDTSSGLTIAAVEFIEAILAPIGFQVQRFGSGSDVGFVAKNALALECDSEGKRYLVFSGHLDTVPCVESEWKRNPFELSESDGRLYGLGVADMKGSVACMVDALVRIQERGGIAVGAVFTFGEEVGLVGIRRLFLEVPGALTTKTTVLLGEPTQMRVGVAHKGFLDFEMQFQGTSGHSSDLRNGRNAIYLASAFALQAQERAEEWFGSPREPFATGAVLNISRIQAGRMTGIIPGTATLHGELRHVAPGDMDELMDFIGDRALMKVLHDIPPFRTSLPAEGVAEVIGISRTEVSAVGYVTEASVLEAHGIPTFVMGPGDIGDCHRANESVSIQELDNACRTFFELAAAFGSDSRKDAGETT